MEESGTNSEADSGQVGRSQRVKTATLIVRTLSVLRFSVQNENVVMKY